MRHAMALITTATAWSMTEIPVVEWPVTPTWQEFVARVTLFATMAN
jgi:hypothetical protein